VAYLALVLAAIGSRQAETVRAAWIGMELTIQYVILPLALGSLLTGMIMALGTKWGLFRHYWVLFSLALTVFAVAVLWDHVPTVRFYAGIAEAQGATLEGQRPDRHPADGPAGGQHQERGEDVTRGLDGELLHAGGGLWVLLVVQVLNVYKPRGLTPYGWRKEQEARRERLSPPAAEKVG
jgi:hypothetical protein